MFAGCHTRGSSRPVLERDFITRRYNISFHGDGEFEIVRRPCDSAIKIFKKYDRLVQPRWFHEIVS